MFRGNILSVDTPDNHSTFLLRNELEMILNTLLLAELTEFYPMTNTMLIAIIWVTLGRDIINVLYILFSVILPLKYLAIDWGISK